MSKQVNFDVAGAKASGYTDQQITEYVRNKYGADAVIAPRAIPTTATQNQPTRITTPQPTQSSQLSVLPKSAEKSFTSKMLDFLIEKPTNFLKYVGEAGYQGGRYIVDPTFRKVLSGGDLTSEELQKLNAMPDTMFVDKEKIKDRANIIKTGLKATAGAASYAVPGLSSIKGAAAMGAIAGGLSSASEDNATLESVGLGALAGGVTGGVLTGAAKAINAIKPSKVGAALQKTGEEVKLSTYVKGMGAKPIAREGGNKLLINMQKTGIKPGNSEQVLEQATRIVQDNSGKIFKATQELDDAGVKIPISDITGALKNELKKSKSVMTKKPIQDVLNVLKADFAGKKTLTPTDIYLLKAEYGPLGSWSKLSSQVEQKQAEVWRDVYVKMNSILDDTLKVNGFDEFRTINDAVHTAIQASQYATRVGNIAPSKSMFGLSDLLVGGSLLPNPAYALGVVATKKAIESSAMSKLAGSAIEGAGKVIEKLPKANLPSPGVAGNIISGKAGSAISNLASESGTIDNNANQTNNSPEYTSNDESNHNTGIVAQNENSVLDQNQKPEVPDPFNGMSKSQLLRLAVAGGAKKSDLEELSVLYDAVKNPLSGINTMTKPEFLASAIENGAGPAEIKSLSETYDLLRPANSSKPKSAIQLQVEGKAQSGLAAISKMENLIRSDKGVVLDSKIPMIEIFKGQKRKQYEAAVASLTDAIGGLRTGASVSQAQQEFYDMMLPKEGDSSETISVKMAAIRRELSGYLGQNIEDAPVQITP